jgi:hypothetical protein
MIADWRLVLWPLGFAVAAGLLLLSDRFWRREDRHPKAQDAREHDSRMRTAAFGAVSLLIAVVAFFVQLFSAKSVH